MLTVSLKKLLLPSLVLAHVLFGALQEATTLPHPKSFQSRAGNLHSCSWKFQITEGYAGKYTELRLLLFRLTFFGMMKGLVNHYETLSWVLASGNPQRQIILLFGDSGLSVRTTKQSSKANFSWHSVFYFCIPKIISTLKKKKKAYTYTLPKLLWKGKSEIQFPMEKPDVSIILHTQWKNQRGGAWEWTAKRHLKFRDNRKKLPHWLILKSKALALCLYV